LATKQATILGIPRDSWVEIPGHGKGKINEAYAYGGAELSVQTVEAISGITIDYYMVTGFTGFKALVTEVGGVMVDVPYSIDDSYSKANFDKGRTMMSGKEALTFVRARHDVPYGDFSRSRNGGLFMLSMLAQARKDYGADPGSMIRWLGAGMRNVRSDIPSDQLLQLAFTALAIPPDQVNNMVTPGTTGTVGGESIVNMDPSVQGIFQDMKVDGLAK
jgi:LCP family protein required for cell wall assembly